MKILLDTSTFLWIISGGEELSTKASDAFLDENNDVFLSVVSLWEICVKYTRGKLPLPTEPSKLLLPECEKYNITVLPLASNDVLHVCKLPDIHRDPFDRILICQAICQHMTFLSNDRRIMDYPVKVIW